MDFSLSSEHEILRESVRSFAENEIQPVARELDEKEEFSYETMRKMAELGLFGVFAFTGMRIAKRSADPFLRLLTATATAWVIGQVIEGSGLEVIQ